MLPAPFAYPLPALPVRFHSPAPFRQMPLMIYPLQALLHCVSPQKIYPATSNAILFESTGHFIELYRIFSLDAAWHTTLEGFTLTI